MIVIVEKVTCEVVGRFQTVEEAEDELELLEATDKSFNVYKENAYEINEE